MSNKIKAAFDVIQAENRLKSRTLIYIQKKIRKHEKANDFYLFGRISLVARTLFVMACLGALSYNLYFTANAYIDLDVNPSIELTVNRLGRIIDTQTYGAIGDSVLSDISIKHKNYKKALEILVRAVWQNGFLQNNGLVSITLQTNDINQETQLLSKIRTEVEAAIIEHSDTIKTEVYSVSSDIRNQAHEHNVSPAKYLAVLELLNADPSASFEKCQSHSIREIKDLVNEHTSKTHHDHKHGHKHE